MKIQQKNHDCGPFAILNALLAIGKRTSLREIKRHTATTEDGTNEHGLQNCVERLGLVATEFTASKTEAYQIVKDNVSVGRPVILCVEAYRHWVAAVGVIGNRIIVMDSWNSMANKAECGINVCNKNQLLRWWLTPNEGYYGIIISK